MTKVVQYFEDMGNLVAKNSIIADIEKETRRLHEIKSPNRLQSIVKGENC